VRRLAAPIVVTFAAGCSSPRPIPTYTSVNPPCFGGCPDTYPLDAKRSDAREDALDDATGDADDATEQ